MVAETRQSTAEECHIDGALGPQVLLLPTGKAVRESPVMKAQEEEEERITRAVERTAGFRQASWLEDTQGEGPLTKHGGALSNFPTRTQDPTAGRWKKEPGADVRLRSRGSDRCG
jgi:hypothetical protein